MSEPFSQVELSVIRRGFARQLVATYGIDGNPDLERAFAQVARENFLGSPPWNTTVHLKKYQEHLVNDPVAVYQDLVFALDLAAFIHEGVSFTFSTISSATGRRDGVMLRRPMWAGFGGLGGVSALELVDIGIGRGNRP